MSFPRYPTYKSSGVEWLGEVPEHWDLSKLGFEAWVRARLGWKGLKAEEYVDSGIAFLSTPNIKGQLIDFSDVSHITPARYDESPEIKLSAGDVLLAKDGSTLGISNVVRTLPGPATVNSSIAVITPSNRLNSIYLYHLLSGTGVQQLIQQKKGGMGVPHLFQSDLVKFAVPVPPSGEQRAIATFLDHETAKIDALIAEQQRLIELLQEKRQAVISHAVTKGLNPDAPMKDSGVEWLGEMPEHWEVGQLRRFIKTVRTGRTPDESDLIEHGDSIPWFTPGSFNDATFTLEAAKHVSLESVKEGRSNIFSKDSVLVVGIGATLGKVGVPGIVCSGNQQINAIESSGKLMPRFLGLFLASAQEQMRISSNASTLGIMNQQKTKELVVSCPPLVEQEQIVFHAEKALRGMLEMSEECVRVVELLQERRSALISAAVTGQIDVRGLVPDADAA